MKSAIALRHVAFEDLGTLAPILDARGYAVSYREAGVDDLTATDLRSADLLIALGGPIGVYEERDHPWIADEISLLESRLAADRPTLGICLGCQMMARALGARVYGGGPKEICWKPVALTDAGRASSLAPLGATGIAPLHWHGDTFDLPDGASRLAETDLYPNQAFAHGPAALGLQFHVEADAARIETWLIGHTVEIAATPDTDVGTLRAGATAHGADLAAAAQACFGAWLDGLPG